MNFRTEAIQAIGRIVNARAWCLRNNRGKYLPASVTAPVINQYRAHKTSWSARGVARFIIRYENNLRRMATGGNQQQQLISKLILEAYHYESKSNNSPARLESRQRVFYDSYQKRIQQIQ